jgi:hypothetical protein
VEVHCTSSGTLRLNSPTIVGVSPSLESVNGRPRIGQGFKEYVPIAVVVARIGQIRRLGHCDRGVPFEISGNRGEQRAWSNG